MQSYFDWQAMHDPDDVATQHLKNSRTITWREYLKIRPIKYHGMKRNPDADSPWRYVMYYNQRGLGYEPPEVNRCLCHGWVDWYQKRVFGTYQAED